MKLSLRRGRVTSLLVVTGMILSACQFRLSVPTLMPLPTDISATETPAASPTPAATATAQAPETKLIVPRLISGSQMLKETRQVVSLSVDGQGADGKRMTGALSMARTHSADLQQSSAVMTGSLSSRALVLMKETEIKSPVLGTAVYRLQRGTFWMVDYGDEGYGCVKMEKGESDLFSSQSTLADTLLNHAKKYLYGKWASDEEVNGIAVQHYVIDAEASNRAVEQVTNRYVENGVSKLKLVDGDAYLAREGGYLVSLRLNYQGELSDLEFKGKVLLSYDHSYPQKTEQVTLPAVCDQAEARADLPDTVGDASLLYASSFEAPSSGAYKSVATLTMNGKNGDGKVVRESTSAQLLQNLDQKRQVLTLDAALFSGISGQDYQSAYGMKAIRLYQIEDSIYMVVDVDNDKASKCTNVTSDSNSASINDITPEELAKWLLNSGNTYGVPVGEVKVNGDTTYHYRLDAAATHSAGGDDVGTDDEGRHPTLVSGDVYLSKGGYHLVRLTANYTGEILLFDFTGSIKLQYDLTPVKGSVDIQLPSICQNANKS